MTLIRLLILFILSTAAAPAVSQTSVAEQQDAQVIESLRANGSDLSKPHDIDFFLIFSGQPQAVAAASVIEKLGYTIVSVESSPDQSQWQVHAKRQMVPALDAMIATTRTLEDLAQSHGGYYDGWGTAAVR